MGCYFMFGWSSKLNNQLVHLITLVELTITMEPSEYQSNVDLKTIAGAETIPLVALFLNTLIIHCTLIFDFGVNQSL